MRRMVSGVTGESQRTVAVAGRRLVLTCAGRYIVPMGNEDRNDLAFWFEKLKATGVPVPSTTVVRAGGSVVEVVYGKHSPHFEPLVAALKEAAAAYGYPVFLRSGHGSGKHDWKDTCFVPDTESMGRHVAAIIEWSECVDMLGLPTETWVVREALPLVTTFRAFSGQMPINSVRVAIPPSHPVDVHDVAAAEERRRPLHDRGARAEYVDDVAASAVRAPSAHEERIGAQDVLREHGVRPPLRLRAPRGRQVKPRDGRTLGPRTPAAALLRLPALRGHATEATRPRRKPSTSPGPIGSHFAGRRSSSRSSGHSGSVPGSTVSDPSAPARDGGLSSYL